MVDVSRILALALGVAAVLAACASRLTAEHGVDPVLLLLLVALLGLAVGGVYQQKFCAGVDFRAAAAVQNGVALLPAAVLLTISPLVVRNAAHAAIAVGAVVLCNATVAVSLYVRAINVHGAPTVAMLFCVIPAVAGVLSWLMLDQRIDLGVGIGLVLGGAACWLNARASGQRREHDPGGRRRRQDRVDAVHDAAVAR